MSEPRGNYKISLWPIRRAQLFQPLVDLAWSFCFGMALIYGVLAGLWLWAWAGLPFWFRVELLS